MLDQVYHDQILGESGERAKAGFVGYATSWATRAVALHVLQTQFNARGLDLPIGLPLKAIQEDGGGFMAWAFDGMQDYLAKRKGLSFVEVMHWKAKVLGVPLAA
jgi:hypothetical protein